MKLIGHFTIVRGQSIILDEILPAKTMLMISTSAGGISEQNDGYVALSAISMTSKLVLMRNSGQQH